MVILMFFHHNDRARFLLVFLKDTACNTTYRKTLTYSGLKAKQAVLIQRSDT